MEHILVSTLQRPTPSHTKQRLVLREYTVQRGREVDMVGYRQRGKHSPGI